MLVFGLYEEDYFITLNSKIMGAAYTKERKLFMIQDLSVVYTTPKGRITIIKDVNVVEHDVVRPDKVTGQVIALVGPSGCGKSTFLKAFTGLVKPTTGNVLVADLFSEEAIQGNAKVVKAGDVGFVDQKYTLFRHKTVQRCLIDALRDTDLSKQEKIEKAEDAMRSWGLTKVKNQYPISLSGGQRQRTAIVEQIFSSGHFMVLDEPFSGLDVINIDETKRAFDMISQEHELNTILFTTHDLNLAVELADSIHVMGYPDVSGKRQSYGTMIKNYDLKEMGLAWKGFTAAHRELAMEIKEVFREHSRHED
jgi:ABC-type nitrate/sulfonate/bicarbonate transport system ATPase subunit